MKILLAIFLLVTVSARAQFESPAMVGAMTAPATGGGGQTKLQDVVDYAKTIPGIYAIYAASNAWFSSSSGLAVWSNLSATAEINLTNRESGTTKQPVLASSALNGNDVLNFDGVAQYMTSVNFALSQPNEYWFVVYLTNTYTAGPYLFGGTAAPRQYVTATSISSVSRMRLYATTDALGGNYTWKTNKFYVVSCVLNGANSSLYTNNVAPDMYSTDVGSGAQTGFNVGAYSASYGFTKQSVALVLAFSTNLDHTATGTSSNLFNLITNCYGITVP